MNCCSDLLLSDLGKQLEIAWISAWCEHEFLPQKVDWWTDRFFDSGIELKTTVHFNLYPRLNWQIEPFAEQKISDSIQLSIYVWDSWPTVEGLCTFVLGKLHLWDEQWCSLFRTWARWISSLDWLIGLACKMPCITGSSSQNFRKFEIALSAIKILVVWCWKSLLFLSRFQLELVHNCLLQDDRPLHQRRWFPVVAQRILESLLCPHCFRVSFLLTLP